MTSIVSQKYAKALFELAVEQKAVEDIGHQLLQIVKDLNSEPQLHHLLVSQQTSVEIKEQFILKAWQKRVHPLALNFIKLVVKKNRFESFGQMAEHFGLLAERQQGVVRGTALVGSLLDDADLKKLMKDFSAYYGKSVTLEQKVDEGTMGGVSIHLNHQVFDGSVRKRLADIKSHLLSQA